MLLNSIHTNTHTNTQYRAHKRCMTVSTEKAISPKSTISTNLDSSVSRCSNSNRDFDWARGVRGSFAPQLPRTIRAGPNACGQKSGGLQIRGWSIREKKMWASNSGSLSIQEFILIWTYPDGVRQLWGGAPRRRAPIWICTEEFEFLDWVVFRVYQCQLKIYVSRYSETRCFSMLLNSMNFWRECTALLLENRAF